LFGLKQQRVLDLFERASSPPCQRTFPGDHDNYPEPNIVVGGGAGSMKLGGQHLVLPERTPIANLHLTLLQKIGVERDTFGDSTGTIAEI
jgi:hypothetical protein